MTRTLPLAEVTFWLTKARGPVCAPTLTELYGARAVEGSIQWLIGEGYGITTAICAEHRGEHASYELVSSPEVHPGQLTIDGAS